MEDSLEVALACEARMEGDEGTPDENGRVHRQKRPLLRIIRDLPLDWLLERNHIPALVMGWGMTLAAIVGAGAGVPLGTILAVNWLISQTPVVAQFVRMAYKNEKNGIRNPFKWDWTWWTRPQSHQKSDVAVGPEVALELQVDPRTFVNTKPTWFARHSPWMAEVPGLRVLLTRHPWLARKIFLMECKLIVVADRPEPSAKRFWARQLDDLLNQRARTPSFVIGMGQLIAGEIVGLPMLVNFAINALVSWIPTGLSAYLSWQTGDMYRLSRPGIRQRPTEVARRYIEEEQLERALAAGKGTTARELKPREESRAHDSAPTTDAPRILRRTAFLRGTAIGIHRRAGVRERRGKIVHQVRAPQERSLL